VALRKAEGLVDEGALVTVIAPEPVDPLNALEKERKISIFKRAYVPGEAGEYSLVFAATDDREVNRRVSEDAASSGVWVNVADDPALCTFHLPARVRRGALQVSVASAGEAPFVVRRVRAFLERRFGPEWAEWIEAAGRFRSTVRALGLPRDEVERRYDRFFAATVDTARFRARVPTEAETASWLSTGGGEAAGCGGRTRSEPDEATNRSADARGGTALGRKGFVSLVGGGPGDAGLLTLRGRSRLMSSDTVVYDRLAASSLPCDLPASVELHCVGKEAGHHPVPQEEISAMLVRLAREGKRVARLKGGDPLVFGRGGEEAHALAGAGIPFEVVPGVTAGLSVPAYAGIPPTHRREAVRVTLLTAHESKKDEGTQVRWDLLAADPHATLVGYMGLAGLPGVVERLLAAGMDGRTPVAVVSRGTTSAQKAVLSTLSGLLGALKGSGLEPPALFIVGGVVRHAEALDWFMKRPLFGERFVMVSPAGDLGTELELRGAEVVEVTLPVTPAARVVMGARPLTGCILGTPEEVDALDDERDGPGWDSSRVVSWCLSPASAGRAGTLGWRNVRLLSGLDRAAGIVSAVLGKRKSAGSS
jgi:uroporphyrin-III C-methyltransferase/precorrin-2 dehydrogenase/sirohydrochlorin ferrochelatase